MESVSLYIIVSIVRMVDFTIYLKKFLGFKRSVYWMLLCWCTLEIVNNLVIYSTASSTLYAVAYLLLAATIALFMCEGSVKRKLLFILSYIGITMIFEMLIAWSIVIIIRIGCSKISINIVLPIARLISELIILIAIIQLSKRFRKSDDVCETTLQSWAGTFLVSASCFFFMLLLTDYMAMVDSFSFGRMVALILIACVDLVSYYFYFVSAETSRMEMETRQYQKQMMMYQEWHKDIQSTRNEIYSIRHDMNNHFNALRRLCKNGEDGLKPRECLEEVGKYLDSIGANGGCMGCGTDSGNLMLDSVIDMKKGDALAKDIALETELYVPQSMNYDSLDLVILLGNLLDNAIEAGEKVEKEQERKILLKIRYQMANLFLMVQNPYDGRMDGQSGVLTETASLKTTKNDTGVHGIGLKNIVRIVEKYNGKIQWKAEDGVFTVDVLLYEFDDVKT